MQHKTLYNTYAKSPCGRCKKKRVDLTWHQVNETKKCLRKHCWHFEKYPEHEVWKQRELAKAKKKANKQINDLLI